MTEKTFTPPPIATYRSLTETEVALMNEVKAAEAFVASVIARLKAMPPRPALGDHVPGAIDQRWVQIGVTQLEQGFMSVCRGIAQPDSPLAKVQRQ